MAVDAISSYNTLPATACLQVLLTAAESISSTYNALPATACYCLLLPACRCC